MTYKEYRDKKQIEEDILRNKERKEGAEKQEILREVDLKKLFGFASWKANEGCMNTEDWVYLFNIYKELNPRQREELEGVAFGLCDELNEMLLGDK